MLAKIMIKIHGFLQGCAHCQNDPLKELSAAVQELETLTSVFYSGSQSSSFKKLNSLRRLDLLRYESEELLTKSTMGKQIIFSEIFCLDLTY